jgi:hypothetical protein
LPQCRPDSQSLSGAHGSYRLDPDAWNGLYELGCLNWALSVNLAAVEEKLLRLTNDIRRTGGLPEVEASQELRRRIKTPMEMLRTQMQEVTKDPSTAKADLASYKAEMEARPLGFQGVES